LVPGNLELNVMGILPEFCYLTAYVTHLYLLHLRNKLLVMVVSFACFISETYIVPAYFIEIRFFGVRTEMLFDKFTFVYTGWRSLTHHKHIRAYCEYLKEYKQIIYDPMQCICSAISYATTYI
jgi:hypothetical protein